MKEFSNLNSSDSDNQAYPAVLCLAHPPAPWKAVDWYWTRVAGIPFLLRNILNIQRGGVTNLILSAGKPPSPGADLSQRVAGDSRVQLKLDWLTDPDQLIQNIGNMRAPLILDGRTLYQPLEIQQALNWVPGRTVPENITGLSVEPTHLFSTMENISESTIADYLRNQTELSSVEKNRNNVLDIAVFQGNKDAQILRAEDFRKLHEQLLQSSGLKNDSLMDRWVTRFVSRQLTRFFLETPFTPNQITILSLILGLGSAWCFYQGTYATGVAGSSLLLLSAWIDCTDGEIARLKFLESRLGKQLDIISDNVVHVAAFFAIGMGSYHASGQKNFILFGSLAALGTLISFFLLSASIIERKSGAAEQGETLQDSDGLADQLANRDFIYLIWVMSLFGKLDWFIILAGIGTNVFAGYLLFSKYKHQMG